MVHHQNIQNHFQQPTKSDIDVSSKGYRPHEIVSFNHKPFATTFRSFKFHLKLFHIHPNIRLQPHTHCLRGRESRHTQKSVSLWIPLRIGIIKSKFNLICLDVQNGEKFQNSNSFSINFAVNLISSDNGETTKKCEAFGQGEADTFAHECERGERRAEWILDLEKMWNQIKLQKQSYNCCVAFV